MAITKRAPPITDKVAALRLPPQSLEAEQSLLGGLLLESQCWELVAEKVTATDFYSQSHRLIFTGIERLMMQSKSVDPVIVAEYLEQQQQLERVGGFAYLAELSKNTPSVANIRAYADIVRERAVLRELIGVAHEIADASYEPQGRSSEELLDLAEAKVFQIAENRANQAQGPKGVHNILEAALTRIEALYHNPQGGLTGLSSGFTDLDKKTAGLQNSDLIIVAARPSMGKTTFALNICQQVALSQTKPALIFSLEMPAEQLMMRVLSSLSSIDQTRIRTGQLDDEDWARLTSSMGLLMEKCNLYIDDSASLTPTELRARARRLFREQGGISLIMVDYLQLMRAPQQSENRTQEITEISRALKALARELEVPVIALSQLNRGVEQRAEKRPLNSDLRESGSIEQDADLILFIYRDEVYHENSDLKGVAEIIIGKQRNGPIGTVRLTFQGHYSRFDNYAGAAFEGDSPFA